MAGSSSRKAIRSPSNLIRLALTGGVACALAALPVELGIGPGGPDWQAALAKGDGGGGGGAGGSGHGGGRGGGPGDRGGPGHGRDVGKSIGRGAPGSRGAGPDTANYRDLGEAMSKAPGARALGLGRQDDRVVEAKGRYRGAAEAGRKPDVAPAGFAGARPDLDRPAYGFAPAEVEALIGRGWKGPKSASGTFATHGHRVRTMVELSKRLGYGAHVGALQANFGTPYENGIADLEAQLADARAAGNEAEVARLEAKLEAAIVAGKPGLGPDSSWATADLDVNGDGVVDQRDLDALGQQEG